jgi:putative flippase GtrA
MLSGRAMIVPGPLQRFLDRTFPWLAERVVVLKAISFGMIGVINGVIDATVFFLALAYLTPSLVIANVLGWLVAVSCSYVMNSYVTFAAESGRTLRLADYLRFVASGIAAVTATTITLVIAAKFMPVWAAKALAIGVSFLVNFSLTHLVVFRERGAADAPIPPPKGEGGSARSAEPGGVNFGR